MTEKNQDASDDSARLLRNEIKALRSSLDVVVERLAKMENHISGRASAQVTESVGMDSLDAGEQIKLPGKEEYDAGMTSRQSDPASDDPVNPASSKGPRIIKEGWMNSESRPAQDSQSGPGENDQQTLRDDLDEEMTGMQEEHGREEGPPMESNRNGEDNRMDEPKDTSDRQMAGTPGDTQDRLRQLLSERDTRLQSARAKAYALHAAEKFTEAAQAYQDYFDLLGNAYSDSSTLQASRECAIQIERTRNRSRRRWGLTACLLVLLGIWIGCNMYVANRMVEGARLAAGNGDIEGLRIYCGRLESKVFCMGSFGVVGYMYGPDVGRWRSQIEDAAKESDIGLPASPTVSAEDHDAGVVYNSAVEAPDVDQDESIPDPGKRHSVRVGKGGCQSHPEPMAVKRRRTKGKDVCSAHSNGTGHRHGTVTPHHRDIHRKECDKDGRISLHELLCRMERIGNRDQKRKHHERGEEHCD